jgi:hypothetical protein
LDGFEMESVGTFYGPLVRLMAIWYILWSFGRYMLGSFGNIFFRVGMFHKEKSGSTANKRLLRQTKFLRFPKEIRTAYIQHRYLKNRILFPLSFKRR